MSLPVKTPVMFSSILRRKELPVRGYEANATLFPIILLFESRNFVLPDIKDSYSAILEISLLNKRSFKLSKLIVVVPSLGFNFRLAPT